MRRRRRRRRRRCRLGPRIPQRASGADEIEAHAGVPEAVGQEPQVGRARCLGEDVVWGEEGGKGVEEEAVVGEMRDVLCQLVEDVGCCREEG